MISRRALLQSAVLATLPTMLVALKRLDTEIRAADGRAVRVSQWSASGRRRGLVLFSHGALSAPEKNLRLIEAWAAAGFEIRAPLHVDSTDHPEHARYGMLDSWRTRLEDMRALAAQADAPTYIAAGHSYGALVALSLGGASAEIPPGITGPLRDPRVDAVVAFSPPGVTPGLVSAAGYATLGVPAFIETGTRDVPYGSAEGRWQVHLTAYDEAAAGDKYALTLAGVDHYFGGLICNYAVPGPPQNAQLRKAVTLSTAFMLAFGSHDAAARRRLEHALTGSGPAQLTRK